VAAEHIVQLKERRLKANGMTKKSMRVTLFKPPLSPPGGHKNESGGKCLRKHQRRRGCRQKRRMASRNGSDAACKLVTDIFYRRVWWRIH
jgi:hypothetical protein